MDLLPYLPPLQDRGPAPSLPSLLRVAGMSDDAVWWTCPECSEWSIAKPPLDLWERDCFAHMDDHIPCAWQPTQIPSAVEL